MPSSPASVEGAVTDQGRATLQSTSEGQNSPVPFMFKKKKRSAQTRTRAFVRLVESYYTRVYEYDSSHADRSGKGRCGSGSRRDQETDLLSDRSMVGTCYFKILIK